ncbi:MAG: DUF192 domain-containing protein [Nitriliruptorales bacterium]
MHAFRCLVLAALLPAGLAVACSEGTAPVATSPGEGAVSRTIAIVDPTEADVPPLHPSVDDYPEATVALEPPDPRRAVGVATKVASTSDQLAHGLMEVEELPEGVGMLFLFAEDRDGAFWMKDTLVPLDIAWADASGAIVDIQRMEPCPPDSACPRYSPGAAYRTALEVPAGWFADVGVDTDWRLVLPEGLPAAE